MSGVVHNPLARNTDPETSHLAAASIVDSPSAEALANTLLATYADGSELTDDEAIARAGLADHHRGRSGNVKRLSDLRNRGFIEPIYDNSGLVKRLGETGRLVMVCRITGAGLLQFLLSKQ